MRDTISPKLLALAREPGSYIAVDRATGRAETKKKAPPATEAELVAMILEEARHEAGHSLADSLLFGAGIVEFSTIDHDGELHGYTKKRLGWIKSLDIPGLGVRDDGAVQGTERARGEDAQAAIKVLVSSLAISAYAGAAAQLFAPFGSTPLRWTAGKPISNPVRKNFDENSLSDRIGLEHNSRVLLGTGLPAMELDVGFLKDALDLLQGRWGTVAAIAAELCQHATVSGKRVDEILSETHAREFDLED